MLMDKVFEETGITATAGIGTNMFLAKVALDITAKHVPDHIGILDEEEFKRTVQHHEPITDIWGIGSGTARRLAKYGAHNLYDVTQLPYRTIKKPFGINGDYLLDHANGIEPCTIADIQRYETKSKSLSNSQVLFRDYTGYEAITVLKEMVDGFVTEMIAQGLYVTVSGPISRLDYDYKHMIVNDLKIWFDDVIWLEEYEPEGREKWLA